MLLEIFKLGNNFAVAYTDGDSRTIQFVKDAKDPKIYSTVTYSPDSQQTITRDIANMYCTKKTPFNEWRDPYGLPIEVMKLTGVDHILGDSELSQMLIQAQAD